MKICNYLEDIVREELEKVLADIKDICKCDKCKLDMTAWALNRLPAQYVVTPKGRIYTKLKEENMQVKVDVMIALTKAILSVSKNPQH